MKKMIFAFVAFSSLQLSAATAAVAPAHHNNAHHHGIVFVSPMEVIQGLIEIQDIMKAFQQFIMQEMERLQKIAMQLQEREKGFTMKAKNMTPEAREKERNAIETQKHELSMQAQRLEEKQQEKQMQVQQDILEKIKAFCIKKNWKLVVPAVIYAAPEFDKTQEVTDGLNAEYKKAQEAKKAKDTKARG